ncbi:hypothetical protein I6G97_15205 [Edwardsiella hoshinae]|uniref:hypothetical protein n=1 Tax=Edwardsiella hoshinae TaxID=93378 RepID=UPI0015759479|nr:hypothetical protein [Edwardsiella hoshinae]QPR27743.1 hypothetical protein I6G97_15205 [Edwardsiella hoshinae]
MNFFAVSSFSAPDSQDEGSVLSGCSPAKMLLSAPPLVLDHLALALLTFLLLLLCPLCALSWLGSLTIVSSCSLSVIVPQVQMPTSG